jgi:RHS repeat-associated protein
MGRRIEYAIDASGRRVGRRVDGAWTQRWLYRDGLRPIAELDAAGAVQSVFVYGSRANVPDAIVRGGRVYRVLSDHLGSVRRVVDAASGAVVQRMSYDAYGRVTEDSAPGWQPFGYAGGLYDSDTGLVRFGARDYDALSGRWTAKDPSGLAGGLNVYEYAAGDPVDLVDVDGNNPLVVFLAEIVSGAIWSAMIDIMVQVALNGPRCINWGQVWSAAKSGAFFGGLFGFFKAWNGPWFCLSGCFVAGTWVDTERGRKPIEEVALGERVGPESDECRTVSTENWVDIGLEMGPREEGAPGHVVLHLLRPREWAERHGAREGSSIELALRELNIEGSARVTSVQRAPALIAGSRCPVTGRIRRWGVSVIAVELERGAPMELTANHRNPSVLAGGGPARCPIRRRDGGVSWQVDRTSLRSTSSGPRTKHARCSLASTHRGRASRPSRVPSGSLRTASRTGDPSSQSLRPGRRAMGRSCPCGSPRTLRSKSRSGPSRFDCLNTRAPSASPTCSPPSLARLAHAEPAAEHAHLSRARSDRSSHSFARSSGAIRSQVVPIPLAIDPEIFGAL